jgi:hypothetical protein
MNDECPLGCLFVSSWWHHWCHLHMSEVVSASETRNNILCPFVTRLIARPLLVSPADEAQIVV